MGLGLGVRLDEIHAPSAPMCLTWRLRLLTGHTRTPLITANTMTTHGMPSSARSTWYYICTGIRRSRDLCGAGETRTQLLTQLHVRTRARARTTVPVARPPRAQPFRFRHAPRGVYGGLRRDTRARRMRRKCAGAISSGCGTAEGAKPFAIKVKTTLRAVPLPRPPMPLCGRLQLATAIEPAHDLDVTERSNRMLRPKRLWHHECAPQAYQHLAWLSQHINAMHLDALKRLCALSRCPSTTHPTLWETPTGHRNRTSA